mmetsp:Transcript_37618/g.97068  ORF Transcript_37618/g.97068 Transcript_37618/m.97068 type:complete len:101 (+) Transcript_37618:15-317(+)
MSAKRRGGGQSHGERRGRTKHKRKGRAIHSPSDSSLDKKNRRTTERKGGVSFADIDFSSIKKYKKLHKIQTKANASKEDIRDVVSGPPGNMLGIFSRSAG